MTDSLEFERKELNKAQNLGIFGLIGALIPIIGLVLGIISLIISLPIKSTNTQVKSKKTSSVTIAISAILLSVLAGAGYFAIYHNHQIEAQRQRQQTQKAASEAAQQKERHDSAVQATLNYCLNQADKAYDQYLKLNGTVTQTDALGNPTVYSMPQTKWDYVNAQRSSTKELCYKASSAGDTSHSLGI